jgi:Derlin-2/3
MIPIVFYILCSVLAWSESNASSIKPAFSHVPSSPLNTLDHDIDASFNLFEKQKIILERGIDELFLSIRGGASDPEYYESDVDSDFDDDDDMFGLDLDDSGDLDDDFSEQSTLSLAVQAFQKSPPLTKMYLTASFLCSAIGYAQNKNEFPSIFLLDWKATLTKLQLWRPITAFFNFGPLGLGWLMTAHFVWTYMSTLERLNHKEPYEFWYMIFFGCTSMVLGYTFLKIPPRFLGHNLSTFLVYVWSRYHEGLEVNMFEMFNTRAEMLPWFFLAQTFLLEGEVPMLDILGIVFGHVYHYLRGQGGIGRCPSIIKDWYKHGDDSFVEAIRGEYKKISSDFEMQQ